MEHVLSPAAAIIWKVNGVVIDAKGEHDLSPKTDDDWEQKNILILYQRKLAERTKGRPLFLKRETDGLLAPFHVECGDPLQGLVAWFKGPQKSKPFTATRASRQHGQWSAMAERPAAQFVAKQVESGALISAGTANGHPAYVPSPATLERVADMDAEALSLISTADWDDIT
jgi:hypothetical protein